ncbi:transcription repressor OFP13-like [Zingiber officinale]|uniref:transcription repressor OFP13-like n=1 Tax=Zingiber officinale TaxID=94328 RepID=UPI001C4D37AD|nr:transcription repressor OFP13-like [Zingiber officinale]
MPRTPVNLQPSIHPDLPPPAHLWGRAQGAAGVGGSHLLLQCMFLLLELSPMQLPYAINKPDKALRNSTFNSSSSSSSSSVMSIPIATPLLHGRWLSCATPKTESFRHAPCTVNSSSFDSDDSCFTRSSPESFSTISEFSIGASPERVLPGLRSSDRLFFEPSCGAGTWSTPEEGAKATEAPPLEGAVVVALETEDPYRDFRRSMEEMVAAHGVRDRSKLLELLVWYLRVNGEKTHGLIVRAFADILAGVDPPQFPCSSIASKSLEMEGKEEEGSGSS